MKTILEYGILPNHNYVDPVEGVPMPDPNDSTKTILNAARWPAVWYREEWDDMIKDPISEAVIEQREQLLPDAIRGDLNDDNNITDVYSLAYLTITPDSLNWSKYLKEAGKTYNKFINRIGDKFIYSWILLPFIIFSYIRKVNTLVEDYYATNGGFFDIQSFATWTLIFAVIMGLLHAIMTPSEAKDDEFDGVESKCPAKPTPTPFSLGDEVINYPQLCFGDSDKEDKYECPYGCYYVGDGSEKPKKCKDNRSVFSLGNMLGMNLGILEPETTMNMPYPPSGSVDLTTDWRVGGEAKHQYKCPPESRFATKWPYDTLCSTTAKRCRATDETVNKSADADEYCEMLYKKNNYDDSKCTSNFSKPKDRYAADTEGPRGKIDSIDKGIVCKLETPYEGYKTHYNCPFPLPAAENTFFSEQGDTRAPVSLLNWAYDRIRHPERQETCTASCAKPGQCTTAEQNSIDTCQSVVMDKSREQNKTTCESTAAGALRCEYYPQNVPLQTSLQNQERYLIVNQQYGENLFS